MAGEKSKSTPPRITFDELKSAAYMGLVDAVSRADGYPSLKYLRASIQGGMQDYMRSLPITKRYRDVVVENDAFAGQDVAAPPAPEPDWVEDLCRPLGKLEKEIFTMYYVEEREMKEIAASKGYSTSGVWKIINQCRRTVVERVAA